MPVVPVSKKYDERVVFLYVFIRLVRREVRKKAAVRNHAGRFAFQAI